MHVQGSGPGVPETPYPPHLWYPQPCKEQRGDSRCRRRVGINASPSLRTVWGGDEGLAGAGQDKAGLYPHSRRGLRGQLQPRPWAQTDSRASAPLGSQVHGCGCLAGRGGVGRLSSIQRIGEKGYEAGAPGCCGTGGLDWCLGSCGNGWLREPRASPPKHSPLFIPGNNDPVAMAMKLINDFICQNKASGPFK